MPLVALFTEFIIKMIKTQIITLDKLDKFLDTVKRHRVVNIIPHTYAIAKTKTETKVQVLKSVLIFYQEI